MALTNIRLGDYIERSTENNKDLTYGNEYIVGVNSQGVFTTPKGNTDGVDLQPYKIVDNGAFVYTPTRINLGSIAYRTQGLCLVSHLYIVFYLTDEGKKVINPTWLFMYLRRKEFGREIDFRLFGSARPEFSFSDICETIIPLPDIETQNKYVTIYNAMLANQQSYERGLEDLKLVCDGYIEDLRRRMPCKPIGDFVAQSKEKNTDGIITLEQGINIEKKFITPQRSNDNFYGRQIVRTGQIAYCTQLNNANVAVALRKGPDCIVSSVYDAIYIKDENELLPEYLMMWLSRSEFGRYVYWAAQGTSYEFLSFENLAGYKIPVPDVEVQKSIVNVYNTLIARKEINEKLKKQIKDICPILIRGSLEDTK